MLQSLYECNKNEVSANIEYSHFKLPRIQSWSKKFHNMSYNIMVGVITNEKSLFGKCGLKNFDRSVFII